MRQEIKLIYVGILKFGFSSSENISIVGLINYIITNDLRLEEEPDFSLNKAYVLKSDEWFWELEWNNELISGPRCLVVWFDRDGCHFQRFSKPADDIQGTLVKYEDFLEQFKWLSGEKV
jgi:hypothetical protein